VRTPASLLRQRDEPLSASFLELFFDLAFVLALGQLAGVLLSDMTVAGALNTVLLLLPLWWVWVVVTWFSDWYARANRRVRALLVGSTLGVILMSAAVPYVEEGQAVLFAGAYVAVHVGRSAFAALALRGHPLRRRPLRVFVWFSTSGVLWLAGAFWAAARIPMWVAAVALDYSGPLLGWWVPRLGRARPEELQLRGGHLTERYQQIFIIALGELLFSAGLVYSRTDKDLLHSAAFLVVFAATVLIGLSYVTASETYLGAAIDQRGLSWFSTLTSYLHLVMIAGVLASSVAAEAVIAHPSEQGSGGAIAITVAGPALFLAGRVVLSAIIYHRLSWPRLIGMIAILVTAVTAHWLPLIGVSVTTTGVLLAVAVVENRPTQPQPTGS
jgi:low temperature requirement protein LtrA